MAKKYTVDELNSLSADALKLIILSMQDQLEQLNQNMERLIEQIAAANNQRYGRSSEKMKVIDGRLSLEFIFNEAEALTETLYVVEPEEESVLPKRKKQTGPGVFCATVLQHRHLQQVFIMQSMSTVCRWTVSIKSICGMISISQNRFWRTG